DGRGAEEKEERETAGERSKHGRRISAHTEDPRWDRPRTGAPGAARVERMLTSGVGGVWKVVYAPWGSGGKGATGSAAGGHGVHAPMRARRSPPGRGGRPTLWPDCPLAARLPATRTELPPRSPPTRPAPSPIRARRP